ncbi:hypothetical protein ASD80_02415 [Devosia sp. Root635]|nr:hypothetical protein ASD80_02415 [Devosia sp. Root635]
MTMGQCPAQICAAGGNDSAPLWLICHLRQPQGLTPMNSIIYLVGLVVIVMAILSFIGLA